MAKKIKVQDIEINITTQNNEDYICLTDMTSNQEEGTKLIEKWLTNKNTIEFLGIWEEMNNPNFNSPEFRGLLSEAGTNRFYMSVKQWVNKTGSIGLFAKSGKFGGTYAHKDIAFNFGLYISPAFQLYIIKEYQRLKEIESNQYGLEWDVRRILSKVNYTLHTDAVKNYIIPNAKFNQAKEWILYAEEADLLNVALFRCTAKAWKEANPERALKGENIRDMASINELAVLSNLESLNSTLIKGNMSKQQRFKILSQTAKDQLESLDKIDYLKSIKKLNPSVYVDKKDDKKLLD